MTDTILLAFILVFVAAIFFFLFSQLGIVKGPDTTGKVTLDTIISDLKRTMDNVRALQKTSDNQTKLIVKVFQILKDSIENDLSQEEALKIIKSLNLPLTYKDKQNDKT
jgi:hypothetical protein